MPLSLLGANEIFAFSIKAYATISALLLSFSIYYAIQVTSEPDWKSNSTLNFTFTTQNLLNLDLNHLDNKNKYDLSRIIEQKHLNETSMMAVLELLDNPTVYRIIDIISLMFTEPLCLWTIFNAAYCFLIIFGKLIQKMVFGNLRHMDEIVLWTSWFCVLGFLLILTQLCKDRFEYLTFSPTISKWAHIKLILLLTAIFFSSLSLLVVSIFISYLASLNMLTFMATDCLLILVNTIYLFVKYAIYLSDFNQTCSREKGSSISYYTDFFFELLVLVIDFLQYLHVVLWQKILFSFGNIIFLIQLKSLLDDLKRRIEKHKNYLQAARLMEKNFPMISKEEIDENDDNCPICWEKMETGRRLPCKHLFHNFCLRSWLEQDISCPTCRKSFKGHISSDSNVSSSSSSSSSLSLNTTNNVTNITLRNPIYHFNGPSYASWLPTVAVEVARPINNNQ